jgi:hypothetical protein
MALEAWGVNIHNSWGSVEIGVAASEGESFGGMALAEDFLIFEAVDVNNRPVADLARAEKVLVTKLYGTLMPLIRYELADSLIIDAGPNPDAPGCRRISRSQGPLGCLVCLSRQYSDSSGEFSRRPRPGSAHQRVSGAADAQRCPRAGYRPRFVFTGLSREGTG